MRGLRAALSMFLFACGCAGGDQAARPSESPSSSATASAAPAAPTASATPAPSTTPPDPAPSATPSAVASTPPTPSAAPSAPPKPKAPQFPPSFLAAVAKLEAVVDKVTDAVTNAKDCKAAADAINAFAKDPASSAAIKGYFTELSLLSPEQVKAATEKYDKLNTKLTTIGATGPSCSKDPRWKAALKAMSDMEIDAMKH